METEINRLLDSLEPAIRYKTRVNVMGESPDSPEIRQLRAEIPASSLVRTLLSEQDERGEIPHHPYTKWVGAHWVLACLADSGHPPGDETLRPLFEQEYAWLLSKHHAKHIKTIAGRVRRCASQESNALYAALSLGFADERAAELAERLMKWQWPDGGWNCDKRSEATHSSYHESLIPLRALSLYARQSGDPRAEQTAARAAEIFLKRELFKRQRDGAVISEHFVVLFYPNYWYYNILYALKVLAEAGFIGDPRCQAALDLLESKRLPDGGFPAEKKYYRLTDKPISGRSRVDWGGVSNRRMNEFVTADALYVLKAGGRLAEI